MRTLFRGCVCALVLGLPPSAPASSRFMPIDAGVSATFAPADAARGGDCDDTNANVFHGRVEILGNRFDDDCDGLADEAADNSESTDNGDVDGDGVSIAAGDCNDTKDTVRRGGAEVVGDLIDNDCDGIADEDSDGNYSTDAVDHDGDGRAMLDRVFRDGFEDLVGLRGALDTLARNQPPR